ncbi:hypothetical protein ACHAQE_002663 [Botrytis cinerea]
MRTRNTGASTSGSRVPHERGYRKLATFMTKVDDVVIFRRFSKLNMLNLLRLQAELASLELSYEAACNIDDDSKDSQERGFTQSFYELREFGQISPGSQLELLDRINDTLNKYNSALLQVSQVLRLDKPDRYDLERLHEWLRDKDQGALFLHTPEEEIWGKLTGSDAKTNTSDQVTLIQRESGFSRGVILTLVSLYDLIWGRHRKVNMHSPIFLTRLKDRRKLKEWMLNGIKRITPNLTLERPLKCSLRFLPPSFRGL